MKNLLYIGNVLQGHGKTPTTIETLSPLLGEFINVRIVSNKKGMFLRLIDMLYSIVKYRKETDYILIDTYSTTSFYYALMCAVLARFLKISYFPFLHGGNLPERLKNSPKLSKLIFSHAKVNISPSAFLEDKFKEAGFAVTYIPNNININEYDFLERKNVKSKLLYVRAFSKIYNPLMAVRALEKIKNESTESYLCMVGPDKGDGVFQETSALAKELGLEKFFEQTGRLSKQDWKALSVNYSFLVNPTNFDNMPVSIIEAMALGLIIVSTNVGGLPYLIEDGVDGFLVDIDDDEAMYKKIIELINSPERCAEVSINARKKSEIFDWTNVSKQWKKVFKVEV